MLSFMKDHSTCNSQGQLQIMLKGQLHCHDVCKILLWSVEYILNQSTANFGQISNLIEIVLVGRAPG